MRFELEKMLYINILLITAALIGLSVTEDENICKGRPKCGLKELRQVDEINVKCAIPCHDCHDTSNASDDINDSDDDSRECEVCDKCQEDQYKKIPFFWELLNDSICSDPSSKEVEDNACDELIDKVTEQCCKDE